MRLDRALVARGLVPSRARAQELIAAGEVTVDGTVALKAAADTADHAQIVVSGLDHYVSRAAHKLLGALDSCPELHVAGRTALDVGASTGGFTQVLLERGAARVHAIDVGHGQLAPVVAADPRVRAREGLNARDLTQEDLGERPDLVVADVSFISLTLLIAPMVAVCADDSDLLLMVKPQFEVGRERLGKGGVVSRAADRAAAISAVVDAMRAEGLSIHRVAASTLPGPSGNVEFFVWAARAWQASDGGPHRPPALDDAEVAAAIERETGSTE